MRKSKALDDCTLETFRNHFVTYQEHYILIGGSATKLLLEEAGLLPRSTNDLDIVICVEGLTFAFVHHFWLFVKQGGYEVCIKYSGARCLYRFEKPSDELYPYKLELLSDNGKFSDSTEIVTHSIYIDDEIISLSAILLNHDYYNYLLLNKREFKGLSIATEHALIPLKILAYLNLSKKKKDGLVIRDSDIKKHKNDVYRLTSLLTGVAHRDIPNCIKMDMCEFLNGLDDEIQTFKQLGLSFKSIEEVKAILYNVFELNSMYK